MEGKFVAKLARWKLKALYRMSLTTNSTVTLLMHFNCLSDKVCYKVQCSMKVSRSVSCTGIHKISMNNHSTVMFTMVANNIHDNNIYNNTKINGHHSNFIHWTLNGSYIVCLDVHEYIGSDITVQLRTLIHDNFQHYFTVHFIGCNHWCLLLWWPIYIWQLLQHQCHINIITVTDTVEEMYFKG